MKQPDRLIFAQAREARDFLTWLILLLAILALAIALIPDASAMSPGPTIAEAKASTPESLWRFLAALPSTFEAEMFYALALGALVGMLGHYVKGRTSGDIAGGPIDYFLRDNLWRSVGAAFAICSELFAEIGSGLFTTDAGAFVGWGLVLLSGIKTGYVGDSTINKGARNVWTQEHRAQKAGEAGPAVTAPATVSPPPSQGANP